MKDLGNTVLLPDAKYSSRKLLFTNTCQQDKSITALVKQVLVDFEKALLPRALHKQFRSNHLHRLHI